MIKILITILLLISPTLVIADDDNPFVVINNTTVDVLPHKLTEIQAAVDKYKASIQDKTIEASGYQEKVQNLYGEIAGLKKNLTYAQMNLDYANQAIQAQSVNAEIQ